ncbi:MAG: fluoride efflux transporter CrcB [Paramuribaculum sp.]|nr:fluoride efflux transporter CrcB [Paramuribaculum sp.]
MIKMMLIAGVGGFVGTCGRFLIGKWSSGMYVGSFPVGTFLVNIMGCFIVGLLFGLIEKAHVISAGENVLLITGFCGGFTTFSSFANDMWVIGSKGDWSTFVFYLAASVIIGVLLVWAGRALIR